MTKVNDVLNFLKRTAVFVTSEIFWEIIDIQLNVVFKVIVVVTAAVTREVDKPM